MIKMKFLFLFIIFSNIRGKEEITEFNDFITISKGDSFDFTVKETESIVYFESLDKRSLIYINEDSNSNKERIDGKFYPLKINTKYHIDIKLYNSESPSILRRYLYPLDLSNKEIIITDDSINYLYLIKNKEFTLKFQHEGLKVITISKKTMNAEIIIDDIIKLNDNGYYTIDNRYEKKEIHLSTKDNDAFIEILTELKESDDYEFLDFQPVQNKNLNHKTSILFIGYTHKDIKIELTSKEPFKFSFSNGFTIGSDSFYYSSNFNSMIDSSKYNDDYKSIIEFHDIFRNITLYYNEKFIFTIKIDKNENKKVYLNYLQSSIIDPLIDEQLSEDYCQNIINNYKILFEYYVYTDIAKNPPKIDGFPDYHHEKIDIQDRFNKVSTKYRYFYEFYQEIQMILATFKDRHLKVIAEKSPKGIKFKEYFANLPFNFIIKNYNSQYRIFIEKNYFIGKYSQKVQDIIINHKDIPIKSINNIDPFDYIQNWSKFMKTKNKHAQFSISMREISSFDLYLHPLNYSDISINEYEFDDREILRIGYYINAPIIINLEFENFLTNTMKYNELTDKISDIDNIYEEFLIFKGKKQRFNSNIKANLDWNISHIYKSHIFKCRVDNIKQVNVIYQNSFNFGKIYEIMGKMLNCTKLFLTNTYPVIVIESNNGGGKVVLYNILLQILQTRIEMKEYRSFRVTPTSKDFLEKKDFTNHISTDDCKEINNFKDITKFYIDSYGNNLIEHNRTAPVDSIKKIFRIALEEFRKEVKDSKNLKKPTDILILTDSYSYSATSGFIKGLQNTGGAVIIGYYGNPKIKGNDLYDGSQSPSEVVKLEKTEVYKELEKNGFRIVGITIGESYNFHQKDIKDQIPREYSLDPVDFRVNIYSDYSDEKYDLFIDEGLNIYKRINQNNECNSKNDKLLLHSDNCYTINGDTHAHGGYKCNKEGKWDMNDCQPYYCDYGYYFDQNKNQKKCIENCKFPNVESYFIYEGNFDKTFNIDLNKEYNFIFTLYNISKYVNSQNKFIKKRILTIKGNKIYNYDYTIKEVYTDLDLLNMDEDYSTFSFINPTGSLINFENTEKDFVLYLDNVYKSSKTQLKLAKYNNEMSIDDMLNPKSKYFIDYNDNIKIFPKNERYLLYINFKEIDPFNIFINPLYNQEIIEINNLEINFLYLEKDKSYILKFQNNLINRMLKLSRETLNSKVIIEGEDLVLNSKNLYYKLEDNYKGELKLNVKDNNALIEFLFKQDDSELEILDFEKKIFILNKKYNILAIPKKYSSKMIDVELNRNEFLTNFTIYLAYTIPPYNYFSLDKEENIFEMDEKFSFTLNEHYKGNLELMENEYYCVMIENFGEDVLMTLTIKDRGKDDQSIALSNWEITLLLLFLLL